MASSQSSKVERYKYLLTVMFEQHKPKCYFCGEELQAIEFYPKKSGLKMDNFTIHHEDQDRSNNAPENLKWAHRTCHRKWHKNNVNEYDIYCLNKEYEEEENG